MSAAAIPFPVLVGVLSVMSLVIAPVVRTIERRSWFVRLVRSALDRVSWTYAQVKSSAVGLVYYLLPLGFVIVVSVVTGVNVFGFLLMDWRFAGIVVVTILAELSVNTMSSTVLAVASPGVDWQRVIGQVPWVSGLRDRHPAVAPWVTPTSAFVEELFFRGAVFGVTVTLYPQLGLVLPIALSALLFAVEQAMFCTTRDQAVAMGLGAVAISVVSCCAFAYTGSLLPSVLAHQSFLVFYMGKFKIY